MPVNARSPAFSAYSLSPMQACICPASKAVTVKAACACDSKRQCAVTVRRTLNSGRETNACISAPAACTAQLSIISASSVTLCNGLDMRDCLEKLSRSYCKLPTADRYVDRFTFRRKKLGNSLGFLQFHAHS